MTGIVHPFLDGRPKRMFIGVARDVRTGMMWVNCYGTTEPAIPSEGYRMSGYGAKGGRRHVEEYLYNKTVWLNLA